MDGAFRGFLPHNSSGSLVLSVKQNMSCYLGIDIGAVSATAAILADKKTAEIIGGMSSFCMVDTNNSTENQICLHPYSRTRGKPVAAATEILEQIISAVGPDNVSGICLTGSGSKLAAAKLEANVVNEFRAIAAGLAEFEISARTVFEMGGETSKYLRLAQNDDDSFSIVDYSTNGDCAAGTGSFIDQQAGRLKYSVEEIGPLVLAADRAAQIAGRCSVFAKSDMIHAQQKGYNPAEVLRGLCNAVARNFRTAVVRSHPVEAPIVFIGGVAANHAVLQALREVFELGDSDLIIPQHFTHIPAIGAAVIASKSAEASGLGHMNKLRSASDSAHGTFPTTSALDMENVLLLRDRAEFVDPAYCQKKMDAYLGVDIGSVSTNVVAIDEDGRMITEIYTQTKGRPIEVVAESLNQIASEWGDILNVRGVGTTGSGRELIGELIGADTINDEITAHKTGATFVGQKLLNGQKPDTIFEIGGQDSKFISLQDGVVVDFTMNDACAAGTGSFLEERAEELDISIIGEFAELALSSQAPIRLGERCTVFMERDVNSYMQRGAEKADLVAGLAYSVVYNYINRVVRGRKIGDSIFFQGGTAYNDSVAAAFAAVTGKKIIVPPHNGVIGAIGVALLARDKMNSNGHNRSTDAMKIGTYVSEMQQAGKQSDSRFRGYDMSKVNYELREFTCKGCSNTCQIQEFNVESEKTYWGDKCSDRYRKRAKADTKPVIEDLFALRRELLLDESNLPQVSDSAATVGIPFTMFAQEALPFWRTFFAHCGLRSVLSEPTNKKIIQSGLDSVVAEPCFPIIVAHGHVANLIEKDVDYVFMPNIISMETNWMHTESYLCPWHQSMPFMIRNAAGLMQHATKFFTPVLHFREGPMIVTKELQQYFCSGELGKKLGLKKATVAKAAAAAFEAQDAFKSAVLAAGANALETLKKSGAAGIVIVGRPYNVHDAGVNLSVARKLRDYYGVNCIPLDCLDTEDINIRDLNENMFWNLGRRVIAAAKLVGEYSNLHIIHITNFKCGPDSFIKHYIRDASGKPFLSLQFDGHSNDAGMMTRCEAYLDSKGILRPWRKEKLAAQMV